MPNFAREGQVVAVVGINQILALQQRQHVRARRTLQLDETLDDAALAARAHKSGIGAPAQQQLHGIDENGFAGARLPGDDIEARAEL